MAIQGVINALTGKKKKKPEEVEEKGKEKKEKHHHHHSTSGEVANPDGDGKKEKRHHKHSQSDKTAVEKEKKEKHHKHHSKKTPAIVEPTAVTIPVESQAKSAIIVEAVAEQPMPVASVAEPVKEKEASSLSSSERSIVDLFGEPNPKIADHANAILQERRSQEVIFSSQGSDALGLHGRLVPPHSMTVTKDGLHYLTTEEAVAKMNLEESTVSQREKMAVGKRALKEVGVVEQVQERKTIGKKVPK